LPKETNEGNKPVFIQREHVEVADVVLVCVVYAPLTLFSINQVTDVLGYELALRNVDIYSEIISGLN